MDPSDADPSSAPLSFPIIRVQEQDQEAGLHDHNYGGRNPGCLYFPGGILPLAGPSLPPPATQQPSSYSWGAGTLPTKVPIVRTMVFPLVLYGCETWTVKKSEH